MADAFFDYELPRHLIAQQPAAERDASRLLVIDRAEQSIGHRHFYDLPELLDPGDLVVLNNTRVVPARLLGHRETTGGKWEGLFLRQTVDGLWEMLAQTRGRPQVGETIVIEPGALKLKLRGRSEGHWLVEPILAGTPAELLSRFGHMPLPPYIRNGTDTDADRERYQTVFAERDGSVAAPTAGLHFTPTLIERLNARGIETTRITLHVGLGTFEPIKSLDPTLHRMHSEWGEVGESAVSAIQACRGRSKRVVVIGTTAARALESAAKGDELQPWQGETDIFIYPPYRFRVADCLVTNFHLPRTTLLLLVSAFANRELIERAYREAIDRQYRFFSYGDAMLVR